MLSQDQERQPKMSECLKKGYLLKCPQKARAFKKWNSRWFVLYGNSARGRVRLEYHDSERTWQQERGKRIIPLVHCVSIKPVWNKEYNHVLEIVTSDKTFYLGAGSKEEEKAWFKALCKIVFGNANRSSIVQVLDRPDPIDLGYHSLDRGAAEDTNLSRSQSSSLARSSPQLSKVLGSREKISLDNARSSELNTTGGSVDARHATSSLSCELSSLVSFESGFDDSASIISSIAEGNGNRYHVTVRPTIASQEAGMTGQYILQITPLNLILKDLGTENIVAEWPIQHLRRYGRGRTKFSFEAGDKCKTGIGVYTFNTKEGDQIFHFIDMHARKLSNQNHSNSMERGTPLHSQSFKPLGESRRRARSEGRLLESSDDSTLSEISESLENVVKQFSVTGNSSFPSQNITRTLDVIEDHESTTERHNDVSVITRPRSKTDINLIQDHGDAVFEPEDQNLTGESMESLLQNPANPDFNSVETVKEQSLGLNEAAQSKADGNGKGCKQDLSSVNPGVESDSLDLKSDKPDMKLENLDMKSDNLDSNVSENTNSVIEVGEDIVDSSSAVRLHAESPFEPLSTSEHAAHNDLRDNGLEDGHDSTDFQSKVGTGLISDVSKANAAKEQEELVDSKDPAPELVRVKSFETVNGEVVPEKTGKEIPKKRKSRRLAQRNRSFEFGSQTEKAVDNKKHSGSFSTFDYRKYRENNEPVYKPDSAKKLQRFASVKKTVEMYEKITTAANEARQKSLTLWKRRSFRSSQKPEVTKRTNDTSS